MSDNAQEKRINEPIKSKNQSLQPFKNRIKPKQDQLIVKNTKHPNPRRQNGLFRAALIALLILTGAGWSVAPVFAADLATDFVNPPDARKPYVMWYWMGGNISQEGVKADLDGFKRAGIGGVQIFNIGGGNALKGSVQILSPEWRDIMKFAITYAGELGIDVALYNSMGGWSASGGPWVTPEMAMQEIVWAETTIKGGSAVSQQLAQHPGHLDFYRDVAVVAFPTPKCELNDAHFNVTVSKTDGIGKMSDWNRRSWSWIGKDADAKVWIQLEYEKPFAARSLTLLTTFQKELSPGRLMASDNGIEWREVLNYDVPRRWMSVSRSFPDTTAKFWRVEFEKECFVGELKLSGGIRIEDWTTKMMADPMNGENPPFSEMIAAQEEVIRKDSMIDLTGQMDTDGVLQWDAPSGDWTVLRFGHVPTGSKVEPADPEVEGLEVDKFNSAALDLHWKNSMQPWLDDPETRPFISATHSDSYERFYQTWTTPMAEQFEQLRGYELKKYLPALTGRVVGSVLETERFLWDYRATIVDLFNENYFSRMQELSAANGIQFSLEPYHMNQFNTVTAGGICDVPMCEVWDSPRPAGPYWMKVASSAAHIYEKPIVQCEALTANGPNGGNWSSDFWAMKPDVNAILAGGVNRFCFHVSVQQPWTNNIAPGQTLAVFGTHFERSNTWWEQMPAFTRYIARAQAILQHGKFVGDILYSVGENTPNASIEPSGRFAPPSGYDYDVCDPHSILNRITVKNGKYVLPDGIIYSLLVLPDDNMMTPQMLRKLDGFLKAGSTIVAPKPTGSPSLSGQPGADVEVQKLADKIWSTYGDQIFWDLSVAEVLTKMKLAPDFKAEPAFPFRTIHKTIGGDEVYFVASESANPAQIKATFRVGQGMPQLWNPLTGEIRALPDYTQTKTETVIPLEFAAHEAFFVVFTKTKTLASKQNFPTYETVSEISGAWSVEFDAEWGGPESPVTFEALEDWTQRPEEGIKYYSGTATYRKTFHLPKGMKKGTRLFLNLGKFKNVAEVRVNGKDAGIVWCAPWQVEITDLVRSKNNKLEIDIANLWVNRLLGDEQLPEDVKYSTGVWHLIQEWPEWLTNPDVERSSGRYTFPAFNHWNEDKKNSPLKPSGLFGPVTLQVAE